MDANVSTSPSQSEWPQIPSSLPVAQLCVPGSPAHITLRSQHGTQQFTWQVVPLNDHSDHKRQGVRASKAQIGPEDELLPLTWAPLLQ